MQNITYEPFDPTPTQTPSARLDVGVEELDDIIAPSPFEFLGPALAFGLGATISAIVVAT